MKFGGKESSTSSLEPAHHFKTLSPFWLRAEANSFKRLSKSSESRSDSLIWTMIGSGPFARMTKAEEEEAKKRIPSREAANSG